VIRTNSRPPASGHLVWQTLSSVSKAVIDRFVGIKHLNQPAGITGVQLVVLWA
jgi:hypothetical protein